MPLERIIGEIQRLDHGGTLAVFLAAHALQRGYKATIYTYNLEMFDPTWFNEEGCVPDIARRLQRQVEAKNTPEFALATAGYARFLAAGGRLRFEDLTTGLIRRYLKRGVPLLTGLSATYLYHCAREHGLHCEYDDILGYPSGHFVLLAGYEAETRSVLIIDPLHPNPMAPDSATKWASTGSSARSCSAFSPTMPTCWSSNRRARGTHCRAMSIFIVVNNPEDWPLDIHGAEVVAAKTYLSDPRFSDLRGAKIFNLSRSYRYQSLGYYVSLLAEARGHKPLPSVSTIQDMKSQTITRFVSDDLFELIQKNLAPIRSEEFVLSIYFGRNLARRYDRLAHSLFNLFPAPPLRALSAQPVLAAAEHRSDRRQRHPRRPPGLRHRGGERIFRRQAFAPPRTAGRALRPGHPAQSG